MAKFSLTIGATNIDVCIWNNQEIFKCYVLDISK